MNMNYLTIAEEKIPNTQVLINLISYRTRQLNNGARPMLKEIMQKWIITTLF